MPAFLNSLQRGRQNSTCFYIYNCITNEQPLNGAKGLGNIFSLVLQRTVLSLSEQARNFSRLFHTGKRIKYATVLLPVLFLHLCFLVCDVAYFVIKISDCCLVFQVKQNWNSSCLLLANILLAYRFLWLFSACYGISVFLYFVIF